MWHKNGCGNRALIRIHTLEPRGAQYIHAYSSSVLSIAIYIMATSSASLSILVKCGQGIVKPRTVEKCSWEETFGALLDKVDLPETTIEMVQISANEKFDPVHVPIDAPVCLCATIVQ